MHSAFIQERNGDLMSLSSFVINMAVPAPKIEIFDRFLFVGPHPDDIEIGAGATAAKLVNSGKKVCFLICTDGRFGLENAPEGTTPEQLIEIRKQEATDSAAVLGVTDVRFLGLSDGGAYSLDDLYRGIANVIGEFRPDVIFAPDPCVKCECHADHLNAGEAVRRLSFFAPFQNIMDNYGAKSADVKAAAFYMTASPNRFVKTKGLKALQLDAILKHKSQFPEGSKAFNELGSYISIRSAFFGIRTISGGAEGFRVLGKTQMHCLPEAAK